MTQTIKPSAAETAILQVLWSREPCSVKDIHEDLSRTKTVGYTTTLKQVQRMLDKGLVSRQPGPGKSFLYSSVIAEDETKRTLFNRFVKTAFGNSVSGLVMHALGEANPTDDEIEEIKKFIEQLESDQT